MSQGENNQILKEICALGSKIIATRTDERWTDGRGWTNFYFMSSADIVKQS